ncbi:MAG: tetratricopeptide repeat protein, partial [Maribacter sp.]|nr:tetratricopeptide repeat protein [Maribacter sp.]
MGIGKYGFFFFFLFCLKTGHTQNISDVFKKTTDSLVNTNLKTYSELDAVLRPFRKDTTLMRYFAKEAGKNEFFSGQSYALNQLGRRYRDISQFIKAINLHHKAYDVATESNNLEFKVYSQNMIGVIYTRTDAVKEALKYYQDALILAETVENPSRNIKRSINVSLNGIGNIYRILGQYQQAIEKFSKSLELEAELENKLGLAINHQNIGDCYEAQGMLEEALENFRLSLGYNNQ